MNARGLIMLYLVALSFISSIKTASSEQHESQVIISGDLRYRHELVDEEKKEMRNRERIRARINLTTRVADNVKLGFQIVSGNDDPVSTNQTLSDGFSTKPLMLDLAFFEWQPQTLDGFTVHGGKIKLPFLSPGKTELLWDGDLRPEGVAVTYSMTRGAMKLFVNSSYLWCEERKEDSDAILLGGQTGMTYSTSAAVFLFGLGYFDYQNMRHSPTFFDAGNSSGNSVDVNGDYMFDFNEFETFSEIVFPGVNNSSVFVDYVVNMARDVDDDRGWLAGFLIGKCKKPGTAAFRYSYRHLEKDALVGAFADSDFIGGGTNGKGHEINVEYQINQKTKGGISYFINKTDIDNGNDYHRLQLDVSFKF